MRKETRRKKETRNALPQSPHFEMLPPSDISNAEDLYERIALAAYFQAEKRGFAPGRELDDWLEAEQKINGNSLPVLDGDGESR